MQMMIGRSLEEYFPSHMHGRAGEELLRVEGLSSPGTVQRRRLHAACRRSRRLCRAGRRRPVGDRAGALRPRSRRATRSASVVRGEPLALDGPRTAMRAGLGLVPEDRKRQGLVLSMTRAGQHHAADSRSAVAMVVHPPPLGARARRHVFRAAARARRQRSMSSRPGCQAAISRSSCWRNGWRRSARS